MNKINKMFDTNRKLIMGFILGMVISSVSVYYAADIMSSRNVSYSNSESHLEANNVQDAVDELYSHASDYSELKGYFKNSPLSYFNGNNLNIKATTDSQAGIQLLYNGVIRGTLASTSSGTTLGSRDSAGEWGKGSLNFRGSTIEVGNSDSTVSIPGKTVSVGSSSGTVNLNGTVKVSNDYAVRTKKTGWGTSLSFDMNTYAQHAIVCVSQNYLYMIWLAGDASNPKLNVTRIYGTSDPAGWSATVSGKTVTISVSSNSTITAFIGAP